MINYKEFKNKDVLAIIRDAQLAISDLLEQDSWKKYENSVRQGNNEPEKTFITQIRNFADNRASRDLIYKLAEDADNLRKRLRKGDLNFKIDDQLKKNIYRALSTYVGLITLIEGEN
ncbi:MAG: hypothetical protein QW622_02505 [Candidatus Pacearchaeota archaeon]